MWPLRIELARALKSGSRFGQLPFSEAGISVGKGFEGQALWAHSLGRG
jgi:hypothetical protein